MERQLEQSIQKFVDDLENLLKSEYTDLTDVKYSFSPQSIVLHLSFSVDDYAKYSSQLFEQELRNNIIGAIDDFYYLNQETGYEVLLSFGEMDRRARAFNLTENSELDYIVYIKIEQHIPQEKSGPLYETKKIFKKIRENFEYEKECFQCGRTYTWQDVGSSKKFEESNLCPDCQHEIDQEYEEPTDDNEIENLNEEEQITSESLSKMDLGDIAYLIKKNWNNVYFGAKPYLSAMMSLNSVDDTYGMDSGKSIVLYFLSNATQWKGEVAKMVKKELKKRVGLKENKLDEGYKLDKLEADALLNVRDGYLHDVSNEQIKSFLNRKLIVSVGTWPASKYVLTDKAKKMLHGLKENKLNENTRTYKYKGMNIEIEGEEGQYTFIIPGTYEGEQFDTSKEALQHAKKFIDGMKENKINESVFDEATAEMGIQTDKPKKTKLIKDFITKSGFTEKAGTEMEVYFSNKFQYYQYIWFKLSNGRNSRMNLSRAYQFFTGFSKPPSDKTLEKWMFDSVVTTPTGKRVEPDGYGPDGSPSWLLVMGMI